MKIERSDIDSTVTTIRSGRRPRSENVRWRRRKSVGVSENLSSTRLALQSVTHFVVASSSRNRVRCVVIRSRKLTMMIIRRRLKCGGSAFFIIVKTFMGRPLLDEAFGPRSGRMDGLRHDMVDHSST